MKLLFASMPTYTVHLCERQAYWHRVRRLGADRISEIVSGIRPPTGKKSICRGLWLIASEAKRIGHDVRWLDIPPDKLDIPVEDLVWAEQLWLYAMTPTIGNCLRLATYAKTINANITVFLGGPHTRYLFEETLRDNKQIDFVESSTSSSSIVAEGIVDATRIPGIAYCNGDNIVANCPEYPDTYSERVDPSLLPMSLDSYYINMSSSQGCIRTCAFCLDGQVPLRLREMSEVKDELKVINESVGKDGFIHFFDASIWALPNRCMDLAKFIASSTVIRALSCDLGVQPIRDDILRTLRLARMRSVAIGFESCDDNVLNFVSKNGTFKERVEIAKHIRALMPSTIIKAYWLLGLPGSTKNTLKDELAGIRYVLEECIVDLVSAKLFVPYPGTIFFERSNEYDLKLVRNYGMFDRFSLPPVCFPLCVGSDYLAEILLECEQLIAECYANRLGMTHQQIALSEKVPLRYNGSLYISKVAAGVNRLL